MNEKSRDYIKTYDSKTRFFLVKNIKFNDEDEKIIEKKLELENKNPDISLVDGEVQYPDTLSNRIMINYGLGTTMEKFITSYPIIINHLIINSFTKTWQEIQTENHEEIFFKTDSCVVEGISELSNYVFLRKLYQLHPYLNHNRLTKFYLYSQSKNYENSMTGFFWMKTIYELTGRTFRETFKLAQKYGFNLNSLLTSQELKKAAEKFSKETTIITKNRGYPSRPAFSILPYMEILLVDRAPVIKKIEYFKLKE